MCASQLHYSVGTALSGAQVLASDHQLGDLGGGNLQMLHEFVQAVLAREEGQPGSRLRGAGRAGELALGREGALGDVGAKVDLLGVQAELARIRAHLHRARGDAAVPHLRVLDLRVPHDPVVVHGRAGVGGRQARRSLAVVRHALVGVHEDVEEPVGEMVKLDGDIQVLRLGELDAAHVVHVGHARGRRGRDVGNTHRVRDASATAGDAAGQALDERNHGSCQVGCALLGGLRVDLPDIRSDERYREAILSVTEA
mmetsp:Transcript_156013/g.500288  ORF Transcript_156013/g.500288 Transcript_156013/m.500288 type:complete len:255 (+) Transcript_156013:127-891(+)